MRADDSREPRLIRKKSRHERHFTQIANSWVRDEQLSYRARGILAAVWSHEDGWKITLKDLASASPKEGIDAVRAAVEELEELCYLKRIQKRGVGNQNLGHDWEISDPHDQGYVPLFPALDNPTRGENEPPTALDNPTRTALDNPTALRTPVKNTNNSAGHLTTDARIDNEDAFGAAPSQAAIAAIPAHERCPKRTEAPHAYSRAGECIDCGAHAGEITNTETGARS